MITLEKIDNIAFYWNKNGILYTADFNDLCEAARRGVKADAEQDVATASLQLTKGRCAGQEERAEKAEAELAAIKAAQPSAISDEWIMQIAKSVGMQGMLSDVVTTTDELKAFARALLSERPASAISDGVSVPREPTDAILEAIWGRPLTAHDTGARKIARAKYADMLAAAQDGK